MLLQSPYRLCVAKLRNLQQYSVEESAVSLDKVNFISLSSNKLDVKSLYLFHGLLFHICAYSLLKDLRLPDGATHLCKFGHTVCAADSQAYKIIHLGSGDVVPLFPYDKKILRSGPIICGIDQNEFLLVIGTPQMLGLGVFVSAKGDAVRGWCILFFCLCRYRVMG
jgi:hypothetical protein